MWAEYQIEQCPFRVAKRWSKLKMGVRSVAVFKLQMSFCTCGVSQHDRVIADPRLGQGENVLNNIKRIERGEQNSQTSFKILPHEKQQWNTNHRSSGNREGIVKCTRNGMTGRQGSEGKISNLNKASTVSAPTPHSQTSTFYSRTTLKSGGNVVSILAFYSAENSEAGCE